jgi:hypothetical protein
VRYTVLVQHRAKPGKRPTKEKLTIDASSSGDAEQEAIRQIKKTSKVLSVDREYSHSEDGMNRGVNAF